jgi:hypothetical protein
MPYEAFFYERFAPMTRRGRCGSTTSVLLVLLLACGGEQRSGVATGDTAQGPRDTAANVASDTMTARDTSPGARDTTPAPVARDTAVPRDTTPKVATRAVPRRAPKPPAPAAPRPRTDTATPADTTQRTPATSVQPDSAAAQPAETTAAAPTATAEPTAPLRDPYHRAPLDTVPQQVYDGWKQYNLNCARCHGEDVLGTTIAPHLIVSVKPDGPINTKELFIQTVCAGRPAKGMPAWCPLGMEMPTIEAIYAYVKGRSDAKLRPGRPALRAGG